MSEDFRIAITGQAAFGKAVLKKLLENGENIVGIFCPPDKEGRPADPIKTHALENDIEVFQFKRMRSPEAIEAFAAVNADLGVMAFVTDIVPKEILDAPGQGTIQYHPSLLPKHRGPSSINWPIIQGETDTGLTIFWPDDGLDTGPVLMQKKVAIGPDDTLGTIYFDNLFDMGVDALAESVQLVKEGKAPRIEQDESAMTYEGWCKAEDTRIDWGKPIDEVYNLVRGADPSPGSNTTVNGNPIQFYDAENALGEHDHVPGTIISISETGIIIAAQGGTLTVGRVKPSGEGKLAAQKWAVDNGIEAGQRFGA
ncbi:MAG: methionyl-tRNA formyltransferase [Candidatus Hydrogenedentota bacterium]